MGSTSSRSSESPESCFPCSMVGLVPRRQLSPTVDPRWDAHGFDQWANSCALGWVRVGYLRTLHELDMTIPYRPLVPAGSMIIGAPPINVSLYNVAPFTWLGGKVDAGWKPKASVFETCHPDPDGFILARVVEYLNQDNAFDDDLVQFFITATFPFWASCEEKLLNERFMSGSIYLLTHYRIKSITVAEVPPSYTGESVMDRAWGIHEFHVSAFCQRIVNSTAPLVKPNLTPERLQNAKEQLKNAPVRTEGHRDLMLRSRRAFFSRMPAAREDSTGFNLVCKYAGIRWVRVWFIQELASRGGPAPRSQDLPTGTYVEGCVPSGARHYVVSHSWAANRHFDPCGGKLNDLVQVFESLGAKENDVAFLDYMSLTQAGEWVPKVYLQYNPGAEQHVEAHGLRVGCNVEDRHFHEEL